MPRWSTAEIAYFIHRATDVAEEEGHKDPRGLAHALLHRIAIDGEPGTQRPVHDLRRWTKRQSRNAIRAHLKKTVHGGPQRRGDVVTIRTKPTWWDLRGK